MAQPNYTNDDFTSNLPNAGLTEADFSAEDLALAKANPNAGMKLLEAKSDWKNATTDDQRAMANASANQVRSQGGYSGGIDGVNGNASLTPDDLPGYVPPDVQTSAVTDPYGTQPITQPTAQNAYSAYTPPVVEQAPTQPYMQNYQDPYQNIQTPSSYVAPPAPSPFSYDKQAPVYQSTGTYNNQYADQQKQALGNVTNYAPFEFDAENNQQMAAYRKQYAREGNRAMQDTIGSLSAATGGIPSTAVASAAGQANNYYMSQLNDKLPQIYESEYNKYLQDFGMAQQKLGTINTQENIDYSKYWDGEQFNYDKFLSDRNQYNTERGQSLNEYQTGLGQYNADRQFGYGQTVDDINYKTGANDTAYGRAFDADTTNYNRTTDMNNTNYNRAVDADNQGYLRATDADNTAYEQKTQAENDAFDRQYKVTVLENDAKTTAYNKAIDRFEMMGYADAQTAETLGVTEGTAWGGAAAEAELAQSKLELEKTQAEINNINKDTQYIGTYKPDSGNTGMTAQEQTAVNEAYARIQADKGTGADYAILSQYGVDPPKATGGGDGEYTQDQLDAAITRLPDSGAVSATDWDMLITVPEYKAILEDPANGYTRGGATTPKPVKPPVSRIGSNLPY